jgi:hypothetical protein
MEELAQIADAGAWNRPRGGCSRKGAIYPVLMAERATIRWKTVTDIGTYAMTGRRGARAWHLQWATGSHDMPKYESEPSR